MSGIDRAIPGRSVLKRCVIGNPLGHLNALGRNRRRLARGARQTEVFATFKNADNQAKGPVANCVLPRTGLSQAGDPASVRCSGWNHNSPGSDCHDQVSRVSKAGPVEPAPTVDTVGMNSAVFTNPVRYLAHQLASPSGTGGQLVASVLNWRNGPLIRAAVETLGARPGESVADVGFGGGLGLGLLLHSVGTDGVVHGFDPSSAMVSRAAWRWHTHIATGRLRVGQRSMCELGQTAIALDALMTVNTAYYIEDLIGAFRGARTVLKPGGRMVVGVGDPHYMRKLPMSRHGLRLRPVNAVVDALLANEFRLADHVRVGAPPIEDAFHLLVATAP